ncbi:hypothetical protein P7K49_016719 [Saguinus oedipus]|uniref:Uncharacterized protein n=1 Tax=Saguinus oedipus TaxID=9490 RepID=A0ABQ9VDN2_SAGOE|nr:hypothetical protein P7K49_016719 [Saguinus oedipus]
MTHRGKRRDGHRRGASPGEAKPPPWAELGSGRLEEGGREGDAGGRGRASSGPTPRRRPALPSSGPRASTSWLRSVAALPCRAAGQRQSRWPGREGGKGRKAGKGGGKRGGVVGGGDYYDEKERGEVSRPAKLGGPGVSW